MIVAKTADGAPAPAPLKEIVEGDATPEERAANLAALAEFSKNVKWYGEHAAEIRDAHAGKYICVTGQELFVGDDPVEVHARAQAAHPDRYRGSFSKYLSPHRGPKIYANHR